MSELERRYQPGTVELRASDGARRLGGYALKFGTLSRNLGGFVETIDRGAVSKSVADRLDVLARFQHRDEFLLGRVSSGTLRLRVDGVGLDYEVDLPDTAAGRDVGELAGRGDLRHSSFAFFVPEGGDSWSTTEDQGYPLRTLRQIQLHDVAPVVDPAYLDTSSGLRSLAEHRGADLAEVEQLARENRLAELIARSASPTVIDLGSKSAAPEGRKTDGDGQRATHPGLSVIDARRALEQRRAS